MFLLASEHVGPLLWPTFPRKFRPLIQCRLNCVSNAPELLEQAQNVPPDSFCWLEFKVNKVFTIGPLKMEFLSRDPDVVEIHEAFGESDLNEILGESGE